MLWLYIIIQSRLYSVARYGSHCSWCGPSFSSHFWAGSSKSSVFISYRYRLHLILLWPIHNLCTSYRKFKFELLSSLLFNIQCGLSWNLCYVQFFSESLLWAPNIDNIYGDLHSVLLSSPYPCTATADIFEFWLCYQCLSIYLAAEIWSLPPLVSKFGSQKLSKFIILLTMLIYKITLLAKVLIFF